MRHAIESYQTSSTSSKGTTSRAPRRSTTTPSTCKTTRTPRMRSSKPATTRNESRTIGPGRDLRSNRPRIRRAVRPRRADEPRPPSDDRGSLVCRSSGGSGAPDGRAHRWSVRRPRRRRGVIKPEHRPSRAQSSSPRRRSSTAKSAAGVARSARRRRRDCRVRRRDDRRREGASQWHVADVRLSLVASHHGLPRARRLQQRAAHRRGGPRGPHGRERGRRVDGAMDSAPSTARRRVATGLTAITARESREPTSMPSPRYRP